MSNRDIDSARAYHAATKLSYINLKSKPPIYKTYTGLPVVSFPGDFSLPSMPTLEAVATSPREAGSPLGLADLSRLLYCSDGLVRKGSTKSAGEVSYRAAASAGALYPVEVYVVCEDMPGLDAGVYHFSPADFSLTRLRKGDYRGVLCDAAAGYDGIRTSPASLIFTAVFWRSAWKYRARSYRYCFWDCGTMLANLLATAAAEGMPVSVVAGFVDHDVNYLVGVDGRREAALCVVPIRAIDGCEPGEGATAPTGETVGLAPQGVSGRVGDELEYPEAHHLHEMSSFASGDEVAAWRRAPKSQTYKEQGTSYPIQHPVPGEKESYPLGEVITARGSTRRFSLDPIPESTLDATLRSSTRGYTADLARPDAGRLVDLYVVVNAVEGISSGSYFYSPDTPGLELLQEGLFREEAGHLCFEQALGADAGVVVFLMADLDRVLARYGNRGYRAAQLEAGILGGKLYLCAHSLGLGASGLTFYDDDVTDFFSPHARGKSIMFVVAMGVKDPINRVRPYRSRVGVMLDALARGASRRPL